MVHSVGAWAGEGEILRTLVSSLGGEREVDVVRHFFLCFDLFLWEEDEELESVSVSPTGELLA